MGLILLNEEILNCVSLKSSFFFFFRYLNILSNIYVLLFFFHKYLVYKIIVILQSRATKSAKFSRKISSLLVVYTSHYQRPVHFSIVDFIMLYESFKTTIGFAKIKKEKKNTFIADFDIVYVYV